eukprot:TRINITY_DN10709_c0_g1_i1.p1 TRINITY_DN10709_c0_g1~~TRINITY_DN10709_c0_g1_i1.p1  ORF type:complete len:350 (-),score=39.98 TRINITY_DN10709_c0_g1_i1:69-1118(-)
MEPSILNSKTLKHEQKRNKQINKEIAEDKERKSKELILLILGTGESGKSTVAKQLRIINENEFTNEERQRFISILHNNIMDTIKVITQASKSFGYKYTKENRHIVRQLKKSQEFNTTTCNMIKQVIKDPVFPKTVKRGSEFQLVDSAEYYFNESNLDRMVLKDYLPTNQDILRARLMTKGVIENSFDFEGLHFRIIDVGGQRTERRKWIHFFEDVTAVIFCVALSEYDMRLREDSEVNRMHESLNLFEDICNLHWFKDTHIILFLNKKDVFEDKLCHKKVPLNACFPDYDGDANFEEAVKFIKGKFLQRCKNPNKIIYPHVTCATDTENIQVVFKAVKGILLHEALNSM